MIERMALAVADARCDSGRPDPGKGLDEFIARVVARAMMEPTAAMILAGRAVPCDDEFSGGVVHSSALEVRAIWQAMLQAALRGDQEG